jgi:hypothetical protein
LRPFDFAAGGTSIGTPTVSLPFCSSTVRCLPSRSSLTVDCQLCFNFKLYGCARDRVFPSSTPLAFQLGDLRSLLGRLRIPHSPHPSNQPAHPLRLVSRISCDGPANRFTTLVATFSILGGNRTSKHFGKAAARSDGTDVATIRAATRTGCRPTAPVIQRRCGYLCIINATSAWRPRIDLPRGGLTDSARAGRASPTIRRHHRHAVAAATPYGGIQYFHIEHDDLQQPPSERHHPTHINGINTVQRVLSSADAGGFTFAAPPGCATAGAPGSRPYHTSDVHRHDALHNIVRRSGKL